MCPMASTSFMHRSSAVAAARLVQQHAFGFVERPFIVIGEQFTLLTRISAGSPALDPQHGMTSVFCKRSYRF